MILYNVSILLLALPLMLLSTTPTSVRSARILCVFPTPAYSHHSVFKAYVHLLASKGHQIVVVKSIDRITYADQQEYNITEINASLGDSAYMQLIKSSPVLKKRGVVADSSTVTATNYKTLLYMMRDQFNTPEVKHFIATRHQQHFDLIVTEAFLDYSLVFAHLFSGGIAGDVPVIQISSGYGVPENFETTGAVSRHPVFYPNMWRSKFGTMSTWQMINEIYTELRLQNEFNLLAEEQTKMLRLQFGVDTPNVYELRSKVKLLFVNVHPLFDNNRPVPPNVQYLGQLHLKAPKQKLAKRKINAGVEKFLNSSTQGAVYVSFGSGVLTADIDDEFVHMLVDTFRSLPYNVLWKYEGDYNVDDLPANVYVQKWYDQMEVLKHKNIKAFVTQGGVQSVDEAIDTLVPMVGVPMMGDQAYNTYKLAELGVGTVVDTETVSASQLTQAIKNAVESPMIRKNLRDLRHLMRHRAMSVEHTAVWYTERVIEQKNFSKSLYMNTKAANTSLSDYVMSYIFVPLLCASIMSHFQHLIRLSFV
ncbi:ecdysteroid UDP-glucosyl transferase [Clanis bilineata nucleopolyhedrovirus]|uniref:Ecdysteroid UDP-glucosyltransferase n=1 Tax=Clanis bilineata nucleopolyhedrovirus TaxID=1307957 RepID=Q5EFK1_9ABAC|nr:ecdysteroid UDP-glucosyl transferase [Clanis bilineata nucleopolyhedrovirus]AAW81054.2 ecdysteroid UDP-glucosyl transferase [Clanis bilineata nucleopolyhedrovirus]